MFDQNHEEDYQTDMSAINLKDTNLFTVVEEQFENYHAEITEIFRKSAIFSSWLMETRKSTMPEISLKVSNFFTVV